MAAARHPLQVKGVPVVAGGPAVDLSVRPGEIVGLAGLVGAGHQELLNLMSGGSRPRTGQVLMPAGVPVPRPRRAAVAAGVALVSGDRRGLGLMLDKPLWENIAQVRSIALRRDGRLIRRGALRRRAREQTRRLDVRARSVDGMAGSLSGGNQQKVVFAKWLELEPQVPGGGAVVILCSTDNQELAELCHRVAVFYQGAMVGELSGARLDEHELLEAVNTGIVQEAA